MMVFAIALFSLGVRADDKVLVQGPLPEVVVSAVDVRADLAAMPERLRVQTMRTPGGLADPINAIYRRKALAAAALAAGLDRTDQVTAQLQRAREEVLAKAALNDQQARLLAEIPDMAARAREVYQADPNRFQVPARVHARHILLRAETPEEQARRMPEAESVLRRAQSGEDFAALAKTLSEDPGSAQQGGDLPPFTRGQMVPEFESAAFSLKSPGALSTVVTSQFGLHIIRLEDMQPERQRSFEEVADALIAELRSEWVDEAVETWRREIIDPAKAKVNHAALAAFTAEIGAEPPPATPALTDSAASPVPK